MSLRPDTADYRALFLTPTPMIDLRAPVEFVRGSFPTALNLPLMSDDERAQVGICYKQQGQGAAIELGHSLVSGDAKAQRLQTWQDFTQQHPEGYLYCWRGGLRSETVQQWLREAGCDYPRITGGYKAMRAFLLEELERSVAAGKFVLIGGKTGTGKTIAINRLERAVDLEGLANHRGSSFGQMPTPQPSQIDFENLLSIAFMRLLEKSADTIFLEDEGRLIGRLSLPESLRRKMEHSPMLVVEQTLDERIDIVVADYAIDLDRRYTLMYGEDGRRLHSEKLQSDLGRIQKRLGGDRYKKVATILGEAFQQQWRDGDLSVHRQWIGFLLEHYYDPMYEYQLEQRKGDCLYQGSRDAIVRWSQESRVE